MKLPPKRDNYSPIKLGDTAKLSNEEWLNWRQHGPYYANPRDPRYILTTLGGSDISTVAELNPWKTKLELYNEKSNVLPALFVNQNAAAKKAGHVYEPYVADAFVAYMKKENPSATIEMWNDTTMFQHPKYRFALANCDRMLKINGIPGILECKTTSSRNYDVIEKWKSGIVPAYYELQCRYYMAILNLQYCYITCCWGFTPEDMAVILIVRDYDIEDKIMEMCSSFIDDIEFGNPPDISGANAELLNAYYLRLYGAAEEKAPALEFSDQYREPILQAIRLQKEADEKKLAYEKALAEQQKAFATLYPVFGGKSTFGSYRINDNEVAYIKIKIPYHKETFDIERFKTDNPALYAKYQVSTFDLSSFKKDEKKLAKDYMLAKEVNTEKQPSFSIEIKEIPA